MRAHESDEIEELFHLARERSVEERAAFLDGACRGDLELRAEVESLLAHGTQESGGRQVLDSRSQLTERGPLQEGPGSVIDRYKLLQLLGEGGFGCVYMAEQKEPVRRRVALKVIKLGMDTRQVIGRFEAERQALALMDHPNIAKVLDAGATQTGRPYFVMELVRGVPITEYCDKAELGTDERLRLFVLVCRAVQHAHQKGIVHRDIKPSNIMVTLHDGEPVPKVIDFGIAKATNQELTEKTVFTQFRQFIGTPEYMSPEQAEMSGLDIDTRADVYSLGVLLYELLTGTTPIDPARLRQAGYDEIQRILCEEEPVRPSTRLSTMRGEAAVVARKRRDEPDNLARSLRGDLDSIVLKALEKDRSRRYETASAFALDVERHLAHEPVVASPPSNFYRMRKFVRRNKGPVLAASALIVALLLGIVGTTAGFLRARNALEGEQQARQQAEAVAYLANEEAARQRALSSFFQSSLLSSGPWTFGSAEPATVTDLLDLAAERLEAGEMAEQPVNRAKLAWAIGIAYLERDRWDEALEHLRLVVELLGDGTADPLTFSRAARELNRIDSEDYFELDVDVDLERLRRDALRALEPLVDGGGHAVAEELFEWADVMLLQQRYAEAAELLRRDLDLVRALDGPPEDPTVEPLGISVVQFNLACVEALLGNDAEARRLYGLANDSLRELIASRDARMAFEWMQDCVQPAIHMVFEVDMPIREAIELAKSLHTSRNLAMAETYWDASWIYQDIGYGPESYAHMTEVVDIARGFEENRLMLGQALLDLAYFEWRAGDDGLVLEHVLEAKPMVVATGGVPIRRANSLLVACWFQQIVAEPDAEEASELLREATALAGEVADMLGEDEPLGARLPWWRIAGYMTRAHRALDEARPGQGHGELAESWNRRLREDLAAYIHTPLSPNFDGPLNDLAQGILFLEDPTPAELDRALELARQADLAGGRRIARPVALIAEALFRHGDLEGAVREGRRALELAEISGRVRDLEERVRAYEAALEER